MPTIELVQLLAEIDFGACIRQRNPTRSAQASQFSAGQPHGRNGTINLYVGLNALVNAASAMAFSQGATTYTRSIPSLSHGQATPPTTMAVQMGMTYGEYSALID